MAQDTKHKIHQDIASSVAPKVKETSQDDTCSSRSPVEAGETSKPAAENIVMRISCSRSSVMQPLRHLPHSMTLSGKYKIKFEVLSLNRLEEVQQLFHEAVEQGTGGVGADEGLSDIILNNPIDEHRNAVQCTDSSSGALLGALFTYPSWLCRSTSPAAAAGYMLITKSAQGKFGALLGSYMPYISWERGYLCQVARTVVGGRGLSLSAGYGQIQTGMIPQSSLIAKGYRLADAVLYEDWTYVDPEECKRRLQAIDRERNNTPLPPSPSLDPPGWLLDEVSVEPSKVTLHDLVVNLTPATMADVLQIESLIRDDAAKGGGFAVDEFADGYFNRRLLRQSYTVTAKTEDGAVIGGAIFGRSNICRSVTTPVMSAYVIIHPDHRQRGVGRALLSAVEEYAKQEKMIGLFVDTFISNSMGNRFLGKCGFISICTLPKCGYVYNRGLTDSVVWYKQFPLKHQISANL